MQKKVKLKIPRKMRLLCASMQIEPAILLQHFVNDLATASFKSLSAGDRKKLAADYLVRCSKDHALYQQQHMPFFLREFNSLQKKYAGDKKMLKDFLKEWSAICNKLPSKK